METAEVRAFRAAIAAEVAKAEAQDKTISYLDYESPEPWVAKAIMDCQDLVIQVHDCPSGRVGIAYEGDLTLTACGRQRHVHPFWTKSSANGTRMFVHEATLSVALAARLVEEMGYPVESVQIESRKSEVDVVAFDSDCESTALLGVEAKTGRLELEAMIAGIERCGGQGGEEAHASAVADAGLRVPKGWLRNHHKKCAWLAENAPIAFWAVSVDDPNGRCFIAEREGERFNLRGANLGDMSRTSRIDRRGLA